MRGAVLCRRVGFRNIKGTVSERSGSNDRRAGESLIRVGAVGIRIWKTSPRFPNSWAGGQTFPRTHNFQVRKRREAKTASPQHPNKAGNRIPECFYQASPDTGNNQPRLQAQQTASYKKCGGELARPRITHSATNNKPQIYRFKLIFLAYLL